ncbi:MAG: hydrogenase formation protein HypD [Planctomycetota bacterium]|nr:hydrogenase formation protein HypD [Planctomycetota bacterium]
MKHVDEYRDPQMCRRLVAEIRRTASRCHTIMEVCGGQTHGLLMHGIDQELAGVVELLHGPGCPVCVTPAEDIDFAIAICQRAGVTVVTFGDMLRVPGTGISLREARARGGDVRLVYSPLDAVQLAKDDPEREFVFFAVGFETTTPATALAVQQAARLGLKNFSMIVSHVRVQPAMEAIMDWDACRVEAFLAAGHVCTVSGYASYAEFVRRYRVPVVVTGFEPVDLLSGILSCVSQLEKGVAEVENCYQRSVYIEGNPHAVRIVEETYEICDQRWRGLGVISSGGLRLRESWRQFDAGRRYSRVALPIAEPSRCRSGDVLTGRIKPTECEFFGRECTQETPFGAPMVSSEGACAAYARHTRQPV